MLSIIEREVLWKYYFASRLVTRFVKPGVFPKQESAGTALSGKWDETIFNASDVNAYQEASKLLAFTDSRGSMGSYVQDVDKNVLLDLCGTENLPLGHNSSSLTKLADTKAWDNYVINSNLDASEKASANFA
jgi:4-aminobutyrate aminotransferase-like enzyme